MLATTPRNPRFGRADGSREVRFPAQVELILSALETGQFARRERRSVLRASFRTEATLRLFSDPPDRAPWLLYTRDANDKGLGFITSHRLPLGYGGMLELEAPNGQIVSIQCTLNRCREAAPGWFEGSLHFNRPQPVFASLPREEA